MCLPQTEGLALNLTSAGWKIFQNWLLCLLCQRRMHRSEHISPKLKIIITILERSRYVNVSGRLRKGFKAQKSILKKHYHFLSLSCSAIKYNRQANLQNTDRRQWKKNISRFVRCLGKHWGCRLWKMKCVLSLQFINTNPANFPSDFYTKIFGRPF